MSTPQQPATTAGTTGLGLKITGLVLAVLIVATAAVIWIGQSSSNDATGGFTEPVMNEDAKQVDLLNTTILIPPTVDFSEPSQTVTLTDGEYVEEGADMFSTVRYEYLVPPVYADIDNDNALDAMAVLQHSTFERGHFYLLAWVWRDGELVQIDRTMSGACVLESLTPVDGGVEVAVSSTTAREGCYVLGADETLSETITLSVVDGNLVQSAPALGAIDRCHPLYWHQLVPLDIPVTPRVAPDADSLAISETGQYDQVRWLTSADGASRTDWYIAQVDIDGQTVCGWVSDEELFGDVE